MSNPKPTNPFRTTTFISSAAKVTQLTGDEGAEIAFAGRSNAGKSSAINAITDHRGLARTSRTPGRTQLINLFAVSEQQRLADLPGYGYAKVPEAMRQQWGQLLGDYFARRQSLRGLVLVMDVRHPLKDSDHQLLAWCEQRSMPVHLLLTKADKLSRGAANAQLQRVRQQLTAQPAMTLQLFSALNRSGVEAARQQLWQWLEPTVEGG